MYLTQQMRNLKCSDFSAIYHITLMTELSMITRRLQRKPRGRLISVLSRTGRKKAQRTRRIRKITTSLSLKRRNLYPRGISRIIRIKFILTIRISREIEMVLLIIRIIPKTKKLQITMGISLRALNERILLSAGNVMARTMLRFAQTGKSQSTIFTLYRKK